MGLNSKAVWKNLEGLRVRQPRNPSPNIKNTKSAKPLGSVDHQAKAATQSTVFLLP